MANHSFNLVTEPWIPVLADGKHESYSLETLFDQPTSIRQLDIADPLGRVSIMRLLLAIMYAARQEGYSSPAEAKRIMEAGATRKSSTTCTHGHTGSTSCRKQNRSCK